MSNPQNPVISSSPIPPPLGNLPWGSIGPDGQVYLNQTSLSFLQMLWSQMQGQGGQIDLSVLNLDAPGTTIGRIAAVVDQIAAQLPLMTPPQRGPARQDVQDAEALADRPRVPGPSRSEVQDADLMAARPRAMVSRQDVQDAVLAGQRPVIPPSMQALLDAFTTTQGSVLYRGANSWSALAPGTSGQFLQTQGASANPQWAAASGGGALTVIATYSGDGTTNACTFSSIPATYHDLVITLSGRTTDANGQAVAVTANGLGGTNYDEQRMYAQSTTVSGDQQIGAASFSLPFNLPGTGSASTFVGGGEMTIYDYAGTALGKLMLGQCRQPNNVSTGNAYVINVSGEIRTTSAISSLVLTLGAGNFVAGTKIVLYGRG